MRSTSNILTTNLIVVFSIIYTLPVSADEALNFQEILSRVYPDNTVTFDEKGMIGTIEFNGSSIPLELEHVARVVLQGETYIIFAVTFQKVRELTLEQFAEDEGSSETAFDEVLVLTQIGPPADIVKKAFDPEADAVFIRTLEVADYIGNGSQQLKIESTNTYLASNPKEIIQAHRYYLYSLPNLDEIFVATTMRVVANEFTKEMTEARKVRFVGDYASGTRGIELYEAIGNTTEQIPFRDGRFEYEMPSATDRDETKMAKRGVTRKTLKIQVTEPDGAPISGAMILANLSWVRSIDWKEMHEEVRGRTDKDGYFEVSTPDNADISIMREGFYTQRKVWSREDITDQRVRVTLEPEHESVSMFVGSIRLTMDTDMDLYEFGIKFLRRDHAPNNQPLTEEVEDADVWVTLYRTEPSFLEGGAPIRDHNNRVWRMKITGHNDWSFMPETNETSKMREAPDGDYVTELDHSFSEMPQGIYLKNDGDSRFGKLMLTVFDHSDFGKVYRYCSMSYNVQAEAVGTRSLNPE